MAHTEDVAVDKALPLELFLMVYLYRNIPVIQGINRPMTFDLAPGSVCGKLPLQLVQQTPIQCISESVKYYHGCAYSLY